MSPGWGARAQEGREACTRVWRGLRALGDGEAGVGGGREFTGRRAWHPWARRGFLARAGQSSRWASFTELRGSRERWP